MTQFAIDERRRDRGRRRRGRRPRRARLAAFDPATGADRGWFADVRSGRAGQIAIAGTRLYVAELQGGRRVRVLRPARRLARAVVAAAARRPRPHAGGRQRRRGGRRRPGRGGRRRAQQPGRVRPAHRRGQAVRARARVDDGPIVRVLHRRSAACSTPAAFTRGGGAAHLAALDPQTGARLPFPEATAPVHDARRRPATRCTSAARPGRSAACSTDGLGAVSLATGAVLPWAPALGCDVDALAVAGATLHAGGCFGLRSYREPRRDRRARGRPGASGRCSPTARAGCGQAARSRAATSRTSTPTARRWSTRPVTDGPVHALALDGTTLHVGGHFTRVQDAPRINVGQVALVGGCGRGLQPAPDRARSRRSRRSPAAGSPSAAGSTRPGTRRPAASRSSGPRRPRRRARSGGAPRPARVQDRRAQRAT